MLRVYACMCVWMLLLLLIFLSIFKKKNWTLASKPLGSFFVFRFPCTCTSVCVKAVSLKSHKEVAMPVDFKAIRDS